MPPTLRADLGAETDMMNFKREYEHDVEFA
jgi:hypothetical protein